MAERWVKGQLEGLCVGVPTTGKGGSGLARWYQLTLAEAEVVGWTPAAGPPPPQPVVQPPVPKPFSQAVVSDCVLRSTGPEKPDEPVTLTDVTIVDWSLRSLPEVKGQSRGLLRGTVYGRVGPGGKVRPKAVVGAEDVEGGLRVNRWGCLAVLAGALIASWLWWSCGPFTCGLWATGVLGSWFVSRSRRAGETKLSWQLSLSNGVLGGLLVVGAFGAALELADPASLSSCGTDEGVQVLVAAGALVAGSLLAVTWPLRWLWVGWTAVMLLWCGRTGTDCAGAWVERGYQAVRSLAPVPLSRLEQELKGLKARVSGEAPASSGAEGGAQRRGGSSGAEASGARGAGHGSAGSGGSASGEGGAGRGGEGSGGSASEGGAGRDSAGADGSDSRERGARQGGAGSGGSSSGEGSDGVGSGSSGSTSREVGHGGASEASPEGDGVGGAASSRSTGGKATGLEKPMRPTGPIVDEDGVMTNEPRVTIEEALRDPERFFSGTARVMLSGDLLFQFDEDVLRPEAEPKLNQLARLLRLDPRKRVLLEGHADTIGGEAYNQGLSERRAAAVRTWLVDDAHINPNQVDTVGFGSSRPIVPQSRGPAAQGPNRRVEVRVLGP
jgi:outer membrane protein OmpA-like peptidoglycan-associated protein